MKILIVEDSGAVLYPLNDDLEDSGHEVFTAYNVAQARAEWDSGKSDVALLIVDLNIPADKRAQNAVDEKNRTSVIKEWHELAGWIWLEQEGLVRKDKAPEKGSPKIAVFSAYLDVWRAQGYRESDYLGVKFFSKASGSAENLLDYVQTITAP